MLQNNQFKEIDQLRNKITNDALLGFSIFGGIAEIFSVLRATDTGFNIHTMLNTMVLLFLWIITFNRKKISLVGKIIALVIMMLVLLTTGLLAFGILAAANIYIVIIPVFISFILQYRFAILNLFTFMAVFVLFGILYHFKIIEYQIDILGYTQSYNIWTVNCAAIFITSWGLLYVGNNFTKTLIKINTKVKNQNIELINKELKYKLLFDQAGDAILLLTAEGSFFDCNNAATELFKVSKDKLLGFKPEEYSPKLQPDGAKSEDKAKYLVEQTLSGKNQNFEWEHIDGEGNSFFVKVSLTLIEVNNEKYIQVILHNITEQKRNERILDEYRKKLELEVENRTKDYEAAIEEWKSTSEELLRKNKEIKEHNDFLNATLKNLRETQSQLIQSEKMASLGVLTAGVAHEINNPLNYIMGAYIVISDFYNEKCENKDENISIMLDALKTGVDRASTIVKSLNQFSRSIHSYEENCDIHQIIDNTIVMLNNLVKFKIEIIKSFTSSQSTIKGNIGKLHQAFLNILTNAIQSIKDKGSISITTSTENNLVIVKIKDTGEGINPDNLKKITDPFFTTKPAGQGTGLGLSITYNIIKEHNGTLNFESTLGKGTLVTIELPLYHN